MKTVFSNSRVARDGETRSSFEQQMSPAIDWNFQTVVPAIRGRAGAFNSSRRAAFAGFRAISSGFFAAEAKREFRIEAIAFAVIVALAAWPIIQAMQALAASVK